MSGTLSKAQSVIQRLEGVEGTLVLLDGVRFFNTLYLEVARAVGKVVFEDPVSLKRLEVNFVELYLAALAVGSTASKCWQPLFEQRMKQDILPIQFALAGMNAHINHDLPIALAQTWTELGLEPLNSGALRRDFDAMNDILAEVEERMRPQFIPEEFKLLSGKMEKLGDVIAIWNIRAAREAAWTNGTVLWTLRVADTVEKAYLRTLDRSVGMASRGLLRRI